ncbi:MAG: hypothetical protein L3J46_08850 [Kangiellaceae bacterium]|nr:hypothetical protein [Kangiellaceae bacterium]
MTYNSKEDLHWSSDPQVRNPTDRRASAERRQFNGRSITVPDMRSGLERRCGNERRRKVRLVITGRAMDI